MVLKNKIGQQVFEKNQMKSRKKGSKTTTLRQTEFPNNIIELKEGHECANCNLKLDEIPLSNK